MTRIWIIEGDCRLLIEAVWIHFLKVFNLPDSSCGSHHRVYSRPLSRLEIISFTWLLQFYRREYFDGEFSLRLHLLHFRCCINQWRSSDVWLFWSFYPSFQLIRPENSAMTLLWSFQLSHPLMAFVCIEWMPWKTAGLTVTRSHRKPPKTTLMLSLWDILLFWSNMRVCCYFGQCRINELEWIWWENKCGQARQFHLINPRSM